MTVDLRHGNCLDILPTLPDCSVDSIVTDPPYELGFMGKKWDNSGIAYNVTLWQECLRVLKPGGHLLAFGGTRTYHRMACAIEDAGFEIRDSIHWLYGSGFPKSLDVSKAIDKQAGAEREMRVNERWADRYPNGPGGNLSGDGRSAHFSQAKRVTDGPLLTSDPATEQAKQWAGWGTALKPAHEPIVVARKPLTGTVAANVLEYGTGAINIDASRIGTTDKIPTTSNQNIRGAAYKGENADRERDTVYEPNQAGRWPANVILTHTDTCDDECVPGCPVALLDEQSGSSSSQQRTGKRSGKLAERFGLYAGQEKVTMGHGDSGGASRFFYCAKPSRRERNAGLDHLDEKQGGGMSGSADKTLKTGSGKERDARYQNHHPTVKPLALMRYLVRLVTPPNGTVLEPFAGSGTTLMACVLEGFHAIGIEMTDEYLPIIQGRIAWAEEEASKESPQQELEL